MALLPVGINNNIIEYRAKTREVVVSLNDANGIFEKLENYDVYFYAKKYPIKTSADLDISIGYASRDLSTGKVTFTLLPPNTDLTPGDYVYEVVLKDSYSKITVLQDKFTIVDSVDTSYGSVHFEVTPESYDFNIFDTSTDIYVNTGASNVWLIDAPEWLDVSTKNNIGSKNKVFQVKSEYLTTPSVGVINFTSPYGNDKVDVQYVYARLDLNPSSLTYDYDTSVGIIDISTYNFNNWSIKNIPTWLSASKTSGIGNDSVTFTANASDLHNDNITIKSTYDPTKTLTVKFDISANVSPDSLSYTYPYSSKFFGITTPSFNKWTISNVPNWIGLSKTTGYGNSAIDVCINQYLNEDKNWPLYINYDKLPSVTHSVNIINTYNGIPNADKVIGMWPFDGSLASVSGHSVFTYNGTRSDYSDNWPITGFYEYFPNRDGVANKAVRINPHQEYHLDPSTDQTHKPGLLTSTSIGQTIGGNKDYTVSFWIKMLNPYENVPMFGIGQGSRGEGDDNPNWPEFGYNFNYLGFYFGVTEQETGEAWSDDINPYPTGNWNHVAFVHHSNNKVDFYFNGVSIGSNIQGPINSNESNIVGLNYFDLDDGTAQSYAVEGTNVYDDLFIYNIALDASAIYSLYQL